MRTKPNATADQAASEGRRAADRREAGAPINITDRRAADRRNGKDRRTAPRS